MALDHPPSAGPADPAGAGQEVHLLLLQIVTASGLLPGIHSFGFVSVFIWSQNVRRLDDSFLPRRLWRAGRGDAKKRWTCAAVSIIPLGSCSGWLEGLLLWIAQAGPAGYLKNALLLRRHGCYVE